MVGTYQVVEDNNFDIHGFIYRAIIYALLFIQGILRKEAEESFQDYDSACDALY